MRESSYIVFTHQKSVDRVVVLMMAIAPSNYKVIAFHLGPAGAFQQKVALSAENLAL